MQHNKRHTVSHINNAFKLKGIALSLVTTLIISGCNFSNSDDKKEPEAIKNVSPTTITIDLITQTETPITDMLSATDANGDSLTFSLEQQAMLGMVTIDGNGEFTYQPNDELTGRDSFTFNVTDGINPAVLGRVNITIETLEVSFASNSRVAFNQQPTDEPLVLNGRAFIKDVEDPAAYDDLFSQ
jgi:VCBS repeat-containing protein